MEGSDLGLSSSDLQTFGDLEFSFTAIMPGAITDATAGGEIDGNQVTYTDPSALDAGIVVTGEKTAGGFQGNTLMWLLVGLGAILIIGGIVFLVSRKSGKKNAVPGYPAGYPAQYGQPGQADQFGQYGQPGQANQFGQYGQPGQQQYGQPGQAQYGQAGQPGQYEQQQYNQTQYGQPGQAAQYGQQQYGQPVQPGQYEQQQYGQPPHGQPTQPSQYEQAGQPGQYRQQQDNQPNPDSQSATTEDGVSSPQQNSDPTDSTQDQA